jgi:hypothetical protein
MGMAVVAAYPTKQDQRYRELYRKPDNCQSDEVGSSPSVIQAVPLILDGLMSTRAT